MANELQKKWFFYAQTHHEGPFTSLEIYQKQKSGIIRNSTYIWCEGMSDWTELSEVKSLLEELKQHHRAENPGQGSKKSPFLSSKPKLSMKAMGISLVTILFLAFTAVALLSRYANEELHQTLRPKLFVLQDKIPALGKVFKPIPTLTDVSAEDLQSLEKAARQPLDQGPTLEVAVSKADPMRPFFYVASNLPSSIPIEVHLIGKPDTLLNRLYFSNHLEATLVARLGKTEVFLAEGGQPLPKGEYWVVVTEKIPNPGTQTELDELMNSIAPLPPTTTLPKELEKKSPRFATVKSVFLGGDKDQTYLTRLKAFHEKVRTSSEKELTELDQYSGMFRQQLDSLVNEFQRILGASQITPLHQKLWKTKSESWVQISTQIESTMNAWTEEALKSDYFYGDSYGKVKSAFDSIRKLYQLQTQYLMDGGTTDKSSFKIQLGKSISEAKEAVATLNANVESLVKAPKTESGLPIRSER